MRTPILAGNWKMHKTIAESLDFVMAVKKPLASVSGVEKVICAPFIGLAALAGAVKDTTIRLGAQNMHWEDRGAFTGEISPVMLKEVCDHVIVGHSERRQLFAETDQMVNRKIRSALAHSLTPIVCVGESRAQHQAGETETFVSGQVRAALEGISGDQARGVVISYEPIWAIGTGLAASAGEANRIIREVVRSTINSLYGETTAQTVRILYGGSINISNIDELMRQPEIDGGLVGGASLKPEEYVTLVEVSATAKGL